MENKFENHDYNKYFETKDPSMPFYISTSYYLHTLKCSTLLKEATISLVTKINTMQKGNWYDLNGQTNFIPVRSKRKKIYIKI